MTTTKLVVLTFAFHPDDAELTCSGKLLKHPTLRFKAGIVDLTQGDIGTRNCIEIRHKEAPSKILGLSVFENIKMPDGYFNHTEENLLHN